MFLYVAHGTFRLLILVPFRTVSYNLGGQASSDLKNIISATNSENSKSMLTELDADTMQAFMAEAANPKVDNEAFVFDKNRSALPSDIVGILNQLQMPRAAALEAERVVSLYENEIRGQEIHKPSTLVLTHLLDIRTKLRKGLIPPELKIKWLAVILENYKAWYGSSLSELSFEEESLLKQIIAEARK